MLYAEILLPVPLPQTFSYSVPDSLHRRARFGVRVYVPFGKSHAYTGLLVGLSETPPAINCEIRPLQAILDDAPLVTPLQYQFWQWLASYYLCSLGDVLQAALPALLKPEEDKEGKVRREVSPTTRTMVHITLPALDNEEHHAALQEAFTRLERSKKQYTLFMRLLDMSHRMQKDTPDDVSAEALLTAAGVERRVLKDVADKGLLTTYDVPVSVSHTMPDDNAAALQPPAPLSPAQDEALAAIRSAWRTHAVCLLHGVTGSGKTEIYTHLIDDTLSEGRDVLYLVPEIALSRQLCTRLRRVFGVSLVVYHSSVPDAQRAAIWQGLATQSAENSRGRLVLGVRSSLFLPLSRLGLVIVDEEHDASYKQQDPAPRYHARDAALMLAHLFHAPTLLGSATPSLESLYLAQQGKYGYVSLTTRFAGATLPEVTLVATDKVFSPTLLRLLNATLSHGEQAILFQNRRGYNSQLSCPMCGWIPCCPRCDVSLTFHKKQNRLVCHYCGYSMPVPSRCPACENTTLKGSGVGTEHIELSLAHELPIARPVRLDSDVTTASHGSQEVLTRFSSHEANVLIGTQMVTKGFDFAGLGLVGVLNADTLINYPNFRSHEQAFQLLAQVAGRAGRREGERGMVVVQCHNPKHPLLQQLVHHDYLAMARTQLADRQRFGYPPFTRLFLLVLRGRYEDRVRNLAARYACLLREGFGEQVLGPEAPPVGRVRNMYIQQILLKVPRELSPTLVRQQLARVQATLLQDDTDRSQFERHDFYYDVDPV